MFLKLVYSHDAVQRFLRSTDRNRLATELENARKELQTATARERSEKLLRSFEDTIKTLEQRIANYDQAQENRELLAAEIVRIEQKVNAVSEMAISARDPADISAQVDGIAEGVSATEEAMRKLDVAPLFERERTPRLLDHTG
jgi:septal ring factor EnvC (AmiA/AmiB activator)